MKTIEEINEIAPYHPNEWQQGYGIWQAGYMAGQKDGAAEQKQEFRAYLEKKEEMYQVAFYEAEDQDDREWALHHQSAIKDIINELFGEETK